MTTEIVVMNTSAVAIAADSAVTVSVNGGKLHYHGVAKIKGISTTHPVAMMIHGKSTLAGVPWETILKEFRDKTKAADPYPKLEDYCDKFANFICDFRRRHAEFFDLPDDLAQIGIADITRGNSSDDIASDILWNICSLYWYIREYAIEKIEENRMRYEDIARRGGGRQQIVDNNVVEDFCNLIDRKLKKIEVEVNQSGRLRPMPVNIDSREKYNTIYSNILSKALLSVNFTDVIGTKYGRSLSLEDRLRSIPYNAFIYGWMLKAETGVVFAGFGADDIFPSTVKMEFGFDIFGGILHRKERYRVSKREPAVVKSFGEAETVNNFLNGISGQFHKIFREKVGQKIKSMNGNSSACARPGACQCETLQCTEIADEIKKDFSKRVLSTIALLPKHVLADIAENLVKITSIESHIRDVDASVGGGVNVAIISKGDGLIWMSRQQYFDPSLNPHYFARYYGNRVSQPPPSTA